MTHVLLERQFDTPCTLDGVRQLAMEGASCMQIYGVEWQSSHLADDGSRLYCHFRAPDAEAMRNVLRVSRAEYKAVWPCELHKSKADAPVNVLVERSWDTPVSFEEIASIEEGAAWCLEAHDVTFVRSFFALDHKRMLCLYQAPDAESVRRSQVKAKMPFDTAWSFLHVTADVLFPSAG